jgi:hypothetical protein
MGRDLSIRIVLKAFGSPNPATFAEVDRLLLFS